VSPNPPFIATVVVDVVVVVVQIRQIGQRNRINIDVHVFRNYFWWRLGGVQEKAVFAMLSVVSREDGEQRDDDGADVTEEEDPVENSRHDPPFLSRPRCHVLILQPRASPTFLHPATKVII